MQLDRRQVDFQQAHVLDDERVHTGVIELPGQLARGLQLVVAQDGVQRDKDAALEPVRVFDQPGDVLHAVVGAGAGAEGRPADVDGVGTVVDGFDADLGVARGGQQFKLVRQERHGRIIPPGPFTRRWRGDGARRYWHLRATPEPGPQ
jgi:hypothetical protein